MVDKILYKFVGIMEGGIRCYRATVKKMAILFKRIDSNPAF
jgi:hypothetical protein